MRRASLRILAVPLAGILLSGCALSEANREQDVTKVEEYLKEKHAGKKWQTGPARIDTAEVRAAYGGLRFYYVFSPPPVPPRGGAAPGPEILGEFRKARAQFEKNNVSLTLALDENGGVRAAACERSSASPTPRRLRPRCCRCSWAMSWAPSQWQRRTSPPRRIRRGAGPAA